MKLTTAASKLVATDAKLSELPDHEKDALNQLRRASEEAVTQLCVKLPDCDNWQKLSQPTHSELRDEILLRFLRYNALSVDKARVQMEEALQWRASSMVASLSNDVIFGMDVGIPIARLSEPNTEGEALFICLSEGYTKTRVNHEMQKTGAAKMFDHIVYDSSGPQAKSVSIVIDFTNLALSQIDLYAMKNGVQIYLSYFPDVFRKILPINYPRVIYGVWKAIAAWLDSRTKSRVIWLENGDEMRKILTQSFELSKIPTWMGGGSETGDVKLFNGLTYSGTDLHKRFHQ